MKLENWYGKMNELHVLGTAVADYGDGLPGVLELRVLTQDSGEQFLVIGDQTGNESVVVGSADQAHQLIEALNAGINKIWIK